MNNLINDLTQSVKRLTDELAHRFRYEERLRKMIEDRDRKILDLEARHKILFSKHSNLESEYEELKYEGENFIQAVSEAVCSGTEQLLWNGQVIEIYDKATGNTRVLGTVGGDD